MKQRKRELTQDIDRVTTLINKNSDPDVVDGLLKLFTVLQSWRMSS